MPSKSPLLDRIAVTVKEAGILIGTNDKQIRKALYARELPTARLGEAYSIGVINLWEWFDEKKRTLRWPECVRSAWFEQHQRLNRGLSPFVDLPTTRNLTDR